MVLLTGGRRLGQSVARALAATGWTVCLTYLRSAAVIEAMVAEITAAGGRAESHAVDLTQPAEVEALIAAVAGRHGGLDAVINMASRYRDGEGMANWQEMLATNATATYLCAHHAAPWLYRRRGHIINFSDATVETPLPHLAPYYAAKAAVEGLTRALAREYAPEIKVNCIRPGAFLKPAERREDGPAILRGIPLGRMGRPDELTRLVCQLLEHDYITGQILTIDGGRALFREA